MYSSNTLFIYFVIIIFALVQDIVDDRVSRLEGLWEELGIDEAGREDRSSTVLKHITELLDK